MRVFITGATGYIGFHAATALRRAGHQVTALVRTADKAKRLAGHEIESVIGAIENPGSYRGAAGRCSVAVHIAVDYAADVFAQDQLAVETLIAARPELLIYTSGIWVYGATGRRGVDETAPLNPPIRVSRRPDMERLALDAAGSRAIVVRPGCVYGQEGGMFGDWFAAAAKGEAPTIVGDGTNRWPLVHVDDLANAYVLAVESTLRKEIINLTDRSRESVTTMVAALSEAAGYRGQPKYVPVAEAAKTLGTFAECLALDQHVDSSKAVRVLGWQPRHGGFADQATEYFGAWKARN